MGQEPLAFKGIAYRAIINPGWSISCGVPKTLHPTPSPDRLLKDPASNLAVQRAEGVIQKEHVRTAVQSTGDTHTLALA